MENKKSIDVLALLEKVEFNPDDVVTAAAEHSVLYVEAIQYRLARMEAKATADTANERMRADVELGIRDKYRKLDEKITEGNIKALLTLDPRVKKVTDALATAECLDEYSKLIVKVFDTRLACLQIVTKMTSEEIRQQSALEAGAEKMRGQRAELRKRFPGGDGE